MRIHVSGLEGIELEAGTQPIHLSPASSRVVPVRVEAERASGKQGSNRIAFTIEAVDPAHPDAAPIKVIERATFVIPERRHIHD